MSVLSEIKQIFKESKEAKIKEKQILQRNPIKLEKIDEITQNLKIQRDVSEILDTYGDSMVNESIILHVELPEILPLVKDYLSTTGEEFIEIGNDNIQVIL